MSATQQQQPSFADQIHEAVMKIAPTARAVSVEVNDVTNQVGVSVVSANGVTRGFRYHGPLSEAVAGLTAEVREVLGERG